MCTKLSTATFSFQHFSRAWNETLIHQRLADELQVSDTESVIPVKELMMLNRQSLADDLDWHDFFSVSFTHHCEILAKTDTLEERAFYIHHDADKTNDDKEG